MKRMRREKKESDQRKKLVIKKEFGKDKRLTGLKKRNKWKIEKERKKKEERYFHEIDKLIDHIPLDWHEIDSHARKWPR